MARFSRCGGAIRGSSFVGSVLLMVVLYVTFQGAANVFFIESNVVHKLRASKYTQLGQNALAVTGEPADSVLHVDTPSGDEEIGLDEQIVESDEPPEFDAGHSLTEEFPTWQISQPLLKVYMYDLPRKFTYGVIEHYLMSRNILKSEELVDDSKLHYPGNQHSAEWYLFHDLLMPASSKPDPLAVRVEDPSEADIFYVPFFSSLSLVVNMVDNLKDSRYSDDEIQEELVTWLEQQPTWQQTRGRNHVVIAQDPNALHKVKARLKSAVLLVSDFGRLRADEGSLVKDVIIPYSHRITTYKHENETLTRDILLFFMGNRYRKEVSPSVFSFS